MENPINSDRAGTVKRASCRSRRLGRCRRRRGGDRVSGAGRSAPRSRRKATHCQRRRAPVGLSRKIHDHPELGFEEEQRLGLVRRGARRKRATQWSTGVCELPTAFAATAGIGAAHRRDLRRVRRPARDRPRLWPQRDRLGGGRGRPRASRRSRTTSESRSRVLGTPAEEGGGGKILMMQRGGPSTASTPPSWCTRRPIELDRMPCLAVEPLRRPLHGQGGPRFGVPGRGINAADAITVAQVAIGLLRQHSRPTTRSTASSPTAVRPRTSCPRLADGEVLRARRDPRGSRGLGAAGHEMLRGRGARDGRLARGLSSRVRGIPSSAPTRRWPRSTAQTPRRSGACSRPAPERAMSGSTDMANVSLAIPSIHPMLGIDSLPAVNHQPEFTPPRREPGGRPCA